MKNAKLFYAIPAIFLIVVLLAGCTQYSRTPNAPTATANDNIAPAPPQDNSDTTGFSQARARLVAYYTFDETSGDTAVDSSGNGNDAHGYSRTGVTHATGIKGGTVQFDGSNEAYLNVPDSETLAINGGFTVMAWVYVKTNTPAFQIIAKGYAFKLLTDSYKYRFNGGGDLLSQTSYTQYQWEHVAIVYDPAQPIAKKKIYVNGVLQGTQNGNIDDFNYDYIFGRDGFIGKLDELKIYNGPLTAIEIDKEYRALAGSPAVLTPTTGLVGYYKFDETGGDTAIDSSGLGNSATGYMRPGVTHSTGKFGGAVHFDGSNEAYLNVPYNRFLSTGGYFTIMAWVYVKTNTPAFQIIAKGYYGLGLLTDSYKYRFSGGGNLLSQTSYTQYQWEHVAIVYDSAQATAKKKIYVNGVLQGTQNGNIDESGDDYIFGRDGFIGKLDELKIYNRPLSAAEIKAEYTLGMTPPAPMTPTTGLVGYYKFDETSGPTAYDSSGLGNDANGYLRTGVTHSTGKFGGAVHFDGSNEAYLNVPYNRFLSTGGYFTIMAWIYTETNASSFRVITKASSFGLWTDNHKYWFYGGGNLLSQTSYTQYTWEHIAIVYSNAESTAKKKIYVNGVLQGTQNGNIDESGDDYIFGGQVLTGKLDELKIYNRPLSNSEILAEYQLGSKMAK